MKKLMSLLLVLAVVMAMLAGCGSTGSTAETEAPKAGGEDVSTTVTSYGEYSAEDPYQLTFAYIQMYQQSDEGTKAVQDAINEYMVENYHMEIELLPLEFAEYQTKVQLMMSGGDKLDVLPIYFPFASSWINMEGIYDMNEFMDTKEGKAIIEAVGEENAYVGSLNGILYGFPANKESVDIGGLCMRADICDELGFTEKYDLAASDGEYFGTIHSWDEATEIFATVKEAYPNMTPLYLYNTSQISRFIYMDSLVDGFGVLNWEESEAHDSTLVVNMYETEEYKTAVTRLAQWYDAGYIYQDAATDTQGYATMMRAGNTFAHATSLKPGVLAEAKAANGCDCYIMYFGNYDEGFMATTNVSFFNTGICNNTEDPEMAFKFISALYTDATLMNLWQYGIEGVHYQVLDDGTAYFVDGEDGANYAYHQNTGWMMGNQFISYVWNDGTKDTSYWERLSAHNDWTVYSPAFGFMWDSTEYSTQLTALTNALETYRSALETGSVGVDNVESTLAKLNEALYAAGLQEVMDEKQTQLDAWLATQK